jgi:hypothetical protein
MQRFISIFFLLLFLISCGKEQGDVISLNSDLNSENPTATPYLVINGQDTNHRGYAIYDLDGTFISGGNFRSENATPRGLTPYNNNSFLISLDTTDSIYKVDLDGTKTLFHGSAQFSGNIYGIVVGPNENVYAVESNVIEVFDSSGIRLTSSLINTTTGACTLSNPRGMTLNANGNLVVVNQGGTDKVLTYDISTSTATCISSVAFGNNPYGVLLHSDGYLYITTQGDNRVYRADPDGSNPVVVWNTNTALINNPTGIVELENGDLLIASSSTDTVERITTLGTRVGTTPFIQDTNSLNIGDMTIILGDL